MAIVSDILHERLFSLEVHISPIGYPQGVVTAYIDFRGSGSASRVEMDVGETVDQARDRALAQLGRHVSHSPKASKQVKAILQAFLSQE